MTSMAAVYVELGRANLTMPQVDMLLGEAEREGSVPIKNTKRVLTWSRDTGFAIKDAPVLTAEELVKIAVARYRAWRERPGSYNGSYDGGPSLHDWYQEAERFLAAQEKN